MTRDERRRVVAVNDAADRYLAAAGGFDAVVAGAAADHDHEERCCPVHGTHTTPHRGCVLR